MGEENGSDRSSLDAETMRRLNEVRKSLWAGGIKGLFIGSAVGAAGYFGAGYVPALRKVRHNNHFIASILFGAAIGSFIGSTVRGKNAIQYIGDIFHVRSGLSEDSRLSSYAKQMNLNEQQVLESLANNDSFSRREEAIRKAQQRKASVWPPAKDE